MRIFSVWAVLAALIRRPLVWVGIVTGLATVGVILFCVQVILDGKQEAERQADVATANIADTIVQNTARTFEALDLSLQNVIRAMKQPEIMRLTGRARQIALFDYVVNAAYVNEFFVLDNTGEVVDSSNSLVLPKVNLADKDYFQVPRDNPDIGMYLSRPFKSRSGNGDWSIAISRRISRPDGSFGGVVVGTLDLAYFQSLFANLSLGPQGVITLFGSDGTIIAQKPFDPKEVGRNRSNVDLFKYYPVAYTGHFESGGNTHGLPRRFTFEQVTNLPLVVSVGFSNDDIYAPWRQKAVLIGALMVGLVLTILVLTIALSREFMRRKAALSRLQDAFDTIPVGLVLFDEQDRVVMWNKLYTEERVSRNIKFGTRYEDTLRKRLSQGLINEAIGREKEWLKERLARHNLPEVDYVKRRPGNRWIRIKEKRTSDGGRIGIRIDITDLKQSEESFRLLLEKNPLPMWVFDHESLRFLTVNDAAIAHYGYSKDAFLSMTVLDIRPAEDRCEFRFNPAMDSDLMPAAIPN